MSDVFAIKSDFIVTENSIVSGFLVIEEGKIKQICDDWQGKFVDYGDKKVLPGFVDLHIHGFCRGSFAFKGTVGSLRRMSEDLVNAGVTSYLPTTTTMPYDFLLDSMESIGRYISIQTPSMGAEVLGTHLEGPFISPERIGLQRSDCLLEPSVEKFDRLNEASGRNVRMVTLAPELEGALELISHMTSQGITASAGHSSATFDEICKAKEVGLNHFTHSYSGMREFHHRELGVVGSLMYHQDMYADVAKQTGMTISDQAFDILYRLKGDERMVVMSDCMGYVDFPEGYTFDHYLRKERFSIVDNLLHIEGESGNRVLKADDFEEVNRLEMDHLASARRILSRLDKNFLSLSKLMSFNPAIQAGVADRKGSLEKGKDADIIVVDDELNLQTVYRNGQVVPLN
ncbi:amidohydrolase family protein [Vibrio sp. 99-8-1]|uniref:N-acetylglucosamine-6-phosphate deacetylase n=1 Tax=Vibrio sp. 99-8-1 TaxID=2607602 RepID=UPI0014934582|nr:amidohydrolase family protein [Vibrio sp. 99-8-1]NOI66442.1 amidohydrolase family protein [Vibrio sp. 99-8-1]